MRRQYDPKPVKRDQLGAGAITVAEATAPPIVKGTQGTNGYSVQALKDAGRSSLAITLEAAPTTNAETLQEMTISVAGTAAAPFSSRAITAGKLLRFQILSLLVEAGESSAPLQRAYLRLRSEPAGATTPASPLQTILGAGTNDAIVNACAHNSMEIADGLELAGDGSRTFGFTLECPDYAAGTATLRVKASILAFEY